MPRRADHYNDPKNDYPKYWEGREYENAAEEMAIRRLLKNKHFKHAVDVGGGYGRLCLLLEEFSDKVTLAEPSQKQLNIAKDFLKGRKNIDQKLLQADDLKFKSGSMDLITMIRVMHHLPDPMTEFREIHRVLSKDGYFILEMANYAHARNRLKHLVKGKKMPASPVDIRSPQNRNEETIPFVNHNPKTVIKQLKESGFKVGDVLSVSNLRSPRLKKIVPIVFMLSVENILQPTLARTYFGPSIFFLVKKS